MGKKQKWGPFWTSNFDQYSNSLQALTNAELVSSYTCMNQSKIALWILQNDFEWVWMLLLTRFFQALSNASSGTTKIFWYLSTYVRSLVKHELDSNSKINLNE